MSHVFIKEVNWSAQCAGRPRVAERRDAAALLIPLHQRVHPYHSGAFGFQKPAVVSVVTTQSTSASPYG